MNLNLPAERTFLQVWQAAASQIPVERFAEQLKAHQRRYGGRMGPPRALGMRALTEEQIAALPDNSEVFTKNRSFWHDNLDEVRALVDSGVPTVFLKWHHCALWHADYALTKAVPEIALFTRRVYQYGKVVSVPMDGGRMFALAKMAALLRDGRPIGYYVDGMPTGKTVQATIYGVPSRISSGPLELFKSIPDLRLVLVGSSYRGKTVETRFQIDPLPCPQWREFDATRLATDLLEAFRVDLRTFATPAHILYQFLRSRERRADAPEAERLKHL